MYPFEFINIKYYNKLLNKLQYSGFSEIYQTKFCLKVLIENVIVTTNIKLSIYNKERYFNVKGHLKHLKSVNIYMSIKNNIDYGFPLRYVCTLQK